MPENNSKERPLPAHAAREGCTPRHTGGFSLNTEINTRQLADGVVDTRKPALAHKSVVSSTQK